MNCWHHGSEAQRESQQGRKEGEEAGEGPQARACSISVAASAVWRASSASAARACSFSSPSATSCSENSKYHERRSCRHALLLKGGAQVTAAEKRAPLPIRKPQQSCEHERKGSRC